MYDQEMSMEIEKYISRTAKSLGFYVRDSWVEVNEVSFSKTVIHIELDVMINKNYITITATDDGKYWKGVVSLSNTDKMPNKFYFKEEFKRKSEASFDAEDLVHDILKAIKETEKVSVTYSLINVRTK